MNDCLTRMETAAGVAKLDKFAYDLDDPVTEARYNFHDDTQDRLCSYEYDPTGDRSTMTDSITGPTSYTVNELNQYTAAGGASLGYDFNGNLTTGPAAGTNWTYVYDAHNRLIRATSTDKQIDFAYDPRNRCDRRTTSTLQNGQWVVTEERQFYYDNWDLVEEHDGGATLVARYLHGAREDELIAKIDSYGTVYYHTDGEGSVVALTDPSGNVIERYKYDAFGAPTILDASLVTRPSSLFGNRFLFTGREWLVDLGLYDYRNRVYSPELGRFLQTDPKSFNADPSNLYRYVGNDPLDRTDPMGLDGSMEQFQQKVELYEKREVTGSHIPEDVKVGTITVTIKASTVERSTVTGLPSATAQNGINDKYKDAKFGVNEGKEANLDAPYFLAVKGYKDMDKFIGRPDLQIYNGHYQEMHDKDLFANENFRGEVNGNKDWRRADRGVIPDIQAIAPTKGHERESHDRRNTQSWTIGWKDKKWKVHPVFEHHDQIIYNPKTRHSSYKHEIYPIGW